MALFTILSSATAVTTVTSSVLSATTNTPIRTIQLSVVGSGPVAAGVVLSVSNDNLVFTPLRSVYLSGSGSSGELVQTTAPWEYMQVSLEYLSGTSAAVTVTAVW